MLTTVTLQGTLLTTTGKTVYGLIVELWMRGQAAPLASTFPTGSAGPSGGHGYKLRISSAQIAASSDPSDLSIRTTLYGEPLASSTSGLAVSAELNDGLATTVTLTDAQLGEAFVRSYMRAQSNQASIHIRTSLSHRLDHPLFAHEVAEALKSYHRSHQTDHDRAHLEAKLDLPIALRDLALDWLFWYNTHPDTRDSRGPAPSTPAYRYSALHFLRVASEATLVSLLSSRFEQAEALSQAIVEARRSTPEAFDSLLTLPRIPALTPAVLTGVMESVTRALGSAGPLDNRAASGQASAPALGMNIGRLSETWETVKELRSDRSRFVYAFAHSSGALVDALWEHLGQATLPEDEAVEAIAAVDGLGEPAAIWLLQEVSLNALADLDDSPPARRGMDDLHVDLYIRISGGAALGQAAGVENSLFAEALGRVVREGRGGDNAGRVNELSQLSRIPKLDGVYGQVLSTVLPWRVGGSRGPQPAVPAVNYDVFSFLALAPESLLLEVLDPIRDTRRICGAIVQNQVPDATCFRNERTLTQITYIGEKGAQDIVQLLSRLLAEAGASDNSAWNEAAEEAATETVDAESEALESPPVVNVVDTSSAGWADLVELIGASSNTPLFVHKEAVATDTLSLLAVAGGGGRSTGSAEGWEALFGPFDACCCEPDRSVLSPAAYLVDLLRFLEAAGTQDSGDPLAILGGTDLRPRRPDIRLLSLSPANTRATLPALDLVNELLEAAVAHTLHGDLVARDSTRSSEELRLLPEHGGDALAEAAWERIGESVYPWGLMDPWTEETEAWLGLRGCSRAALLRDAEQEGPGGEDGRVLAAALAVLGLNPADGELVAGEGGVSALEAWGLSELPGVSTLLRQADLPAQDLEELLALPFIQGAEALSLARHANPCDPAAWTLLGLNSDHLDRLHRFLRLQRAMGWSVYELGLAMDVLGSELDASTLVALSRVVELQQLLGLSAEEQLSWWGELSSRAPRGGRSLYQRVFQRPALLADADSADLVDSETPLGADMETLAAAAGSALGLPQASVLGLLGLCSGNSTRALLSELHALASVCRATGLRPDSDGDLALLETLQLRASPWEALRALRLLRRAFGSGLDTTELAALFLGVGVLTTGTAPEGLQEADSRLQVLGEALGVSDTRAGLLLAAKSGVEDALLSDDEEAAQQAWSSLVQAAQVAGSLDAHDAELAWLLEGGAGHGLLDWSGAWTGQIFAWDRSRAWLEQREILGLSGQDWADWMGESELTPALQSLAALVPGGTRELPRLMALSRLAARAQALGVGAQQLDAWLQPQPDASASSAARLAAQASPAWSQRARAISDGLRERRRDSLVACLIADPHWPNLTDARAISEHLLIDVELSACRQVSRVKQAILSVQTFVQRCSLGLEASALRPEDLSAWEALGRYRVWEANRKIFLWPENWLRPELRGDRTQLFKEADAALMQGELSRSRIKQVFARYLEQLEVANDLEVCAVLQQGQVLGEKWDDSALHLFARTREKPHKYFYRVRQGRVQWTPWEPMQVQVEGDTLVPMLVDEQVMLIWATLEGLPQAGSGRSRALVKLGSAGEAGLRSLDAVVAERSNPQVTFHSSRRVGDRWTEARVVKEVLGGKSPESPLLLPSLSAFERARGVRFAMVEEQPGLSVELDKTTQAAELQQTAAVDRSKDSCPVRDIDPFDNLYPEDIFLDARNGKVTVYAGHRRWVKYNSVWDGLQEVAVLPELPAEIIGAFQIPLVSESYGTVRDHTGYASLGTLSVGAAGTRLTVQRPADGYETVSYTDGAPGFVGHASLPNAMFVPEGMERVGNARRPTSPGGDHPFTLLSGWSAQGLPDRVTLLTRAGGPEGDFRWVAPAQPWFTAGDIIGYDGVEPVVYQDSRHSLLFETVQGTDRPLAWSASSLEHPFAAEFQVLWAQAEPWDGLLRYEVQDRAPQAVFDEHLVPSDHVQAPEDLRQGVDFSIGGASSVYNWEIFLHLPMLIATRLGEQGHHEEAQRWLHTLFDPREAEVWRCRPLRHEPVQTLAEMLYGDGSPEEVPVDWSLRDVDDQLRHWHRNPFDPHAIARLRLGAYKKAVVMAYIDNLLAWGDQLFAEHSLETVAEATQLYELAAHVLGPKPECLPPEASKDFSFATLDTVAGPLGNAVEARWGDGTRTGDAAGPELDLRFCIPPNELLLARWDQVEDRLYKVRHCLDLQGQVRPMRLFEAPIDPGLLARARAVGLEVGGSGSGSDLPLYRFRVWLQKAQQVCGRAQSLASAMHGAWEREQAEELALLRQQHQGELLALSRGVQVQSIREAELRLAALEQSRHTLQVRLDHMAAILAEQGPYYLNALELEHIEQLDLASKVRMVQHELHAMASVYHVIPQTIIGLGAGVEFGGKQLGDLTSALAWVAGVAAGSHETAAARAKLRGEQARRARAWEHEARVMESQRLQLETDLEAARLRLEIAESQLQRLDQEAQQHAELDRVMRSRFSNEELFAWMRGQLSQLSWLAYQLALDAAQKAEKAYEYELGLTQSAGIVGSGHWDASRAGLLAAERLMHDLDRLDTRYLEQNQRHAQLSKHVSLARLTAVGGGSPLLDLLSTGSCEFELDEALFNRDFPGQFMRRLHDVAITIPCVTGPYVSVNCRLTLSSSRVRWESSTSPLLDLNEGPRWIVTSTAQRDDGLFDGLGDDGRYLPFEGAGAVGSWKLELPAGSNQFDLSTVTDVILHLRYTARDSDGVVADYAPRDFTALISARQHFADAWYRLQHDASSTSLELRLERTRFPYHTGGPLENLTVTGVRTQTGPEFSELITLTDPPAVISKLSAAGGGQTLELSGFAEDPASLDDLWLVLSYQS